MECITYASTGSNHSVLTLGVQYARTLWFNYSDGLRFLRQVAHSSL